MDKLQKAVEAFRKKATDLFKMNKINQLLQYKLNVAKLADGLKTNLKEEEKELETLVYDETKLDTKHPKYEEKKKKADKYIAEQGKIVAELKEEITKVEKTIAEKTKEYDEKIAGWENGTRKSEGMEETITQMASQLMSKDLSD